MVSEGSGIACTHSRLILMVVVGVGIALRAWSRGPKGGWNGLTLCKDRGTTKLALACELARVVKGLHSSVRLSRAIIRA